MISGLEFLDQSLSLPVQLIVSSVAKLTTVLTSTQKEETSMALESSKLGSHQVCIQFKMYHSF